MRDRILFVLKKREGDWGPYSRSTGLLNSVTYIVDMLVRNGRDAALVEVTDNNDLDREVTRHRPHFVVIEAFWVVPEKFDVLMPLHPTVSWAVRNHSELPFLANEGIAMEWLRGYLARGVEVMCNSPRAVADIRGIARDYCFTDRLVTYAPNYYPIEHSGCFRPRAIGGTLDIGCFGAIRPLKNTLAQAVAAASFCRMARKRLRFHVNDSRLEQNGDPVLKNLDAFFDAAINAELVRHPWCERDRFLGVVGQMDIVMQVSLSETYNLVSADAAGRGVPVLVSDEVPWLGDYAKADPNSVTSMIAGLERIMANHGPALLERQRLDIENYNRLSRDEWMRRFA